MNKIQQFIKYNKLDLSDTGSGFNSTCTILAGYALYLNGDTDDSEQVLKDIQEDDLYTLTTDQAEEFEKVFNFAYENNYADFWNTTEAQSQYIFEPLEEEE